MDNSQTLSQTQRIATKLSQQQLRFVRLLELTAPEFEEAVSQELESNPALEAVEQTATARDMEKEEPWHAWSRRAAGSSADMAPELPAPDEGPGLYEYLEMQLAEKDLDPDIEMAARFLIGSLDSNGYLRAPLRQVMLDLALTGEADLPEERSREALRTVRELDPPGVGATSLRDCLLLQIERMPPSRTRDDARDILSEGFEEFSLKHYDRLGTALRLPQERVADAVALILQLNPKPGAQFESRAMSASNYVVPDFILEDGERGLSITVSNRIPELVIEQSFSEAMETLRQNAESGKRRGNEFVTSRFNDARDFIRIVAQRQQTLALVAAAILKLQGEYFESRDIYRLRPMMIKDIMALTGLDASTVSRATAGKYIQTPWGIFPMRFFFSDTVGDNGEDTEALTNRKLEAEIRRLVDEEDKRRPLSDDRLQQALQQSGYDISRRTVAKYRDRLRIPVARLRKEL